VITADPLVNKSGGHGSVICHKCKRSGHIARFRGSKGQMWCNFCQKPTHNETTCRNKGKATKDKAKVTNTGIEKEDEFVFKVNAEYMPSLQSRSMLADCGVIAHTMFSESLQMEVN